MRFGLLCITLCTKPGLSDGFGADFPDAGFAVAAAVCLAVALGATRAATSTADLPPPEDAAGLFAAATRDDGAEGFAAAADLAVAADFTAAAGLVAEAGLAAVAGLVAEAGLAFAAGFAAGALLAEADGRAAALFAGCSDGLAAEGRAAAVGLTAEALAETNEDAPVFFGAGALWVRVFADVVCLGGCVFLLSFINKNPPISIEKIICEGIISFYMSYVNTKCERNARIKKDFVGL